VSGVRDTRRRARGSGRIQHLQFLAFLFLLIAFSAALALFMDLDDAFIIGFDAAALLFILYSLLRMNHASPDNLREHAAQNDAGRTLLLVIVILLLLVVLLAIGIELQQTGGSNRWDVLIVVLTLAIAWTFGNVFYAFHYAHMFYDPGPGGADHAGLVFPGTVTPDFWDFCYFAFVLGMTFQVSDVKVASARIRRTALIHALVAFFFNIGVVALTVNVIAGAI